ncbi:zinc finger FYVE domain-containing protein 26 isoform X1 [Polypterus senegalus]|uniref:zinc finger FYVE domain-containing protein 26 isoform X1 n=1 Tax=Polypterus senegalus TaxID=55291 RepID=UPI0019642F87|nr:zinc finger FYVE domain-containing protein 26 isoform X1 [Polypterus senegalus]
MNMHPFGQEEQTSVEKLFAFFTWCLRQGEWELAQASIGQLKEWHGEGAGQVEEILQAVVSCPYKLRWETVGSPHRLAWFWLLVLEKWFPDKVPEFVKRELEFMLLLEELPSGTTENVLKELHLAFLHIHSPHIIQERKREHWSRPLSAETTLCLQALLEKVPRLAQALIGYLLTDGSESVHVEHNFLLQKLFTEFLQDSLNRLRNDRQIPSSSEQRRTIENVYSVLSVMHVHPDRQAAQLWNLCESLFDATWGEAGFLCEERILACLLRPGNYALVNLYSSVASKMRKGKLLKQTSFSVDVPESEKEILGVFSCLDRTSAWKTFYFDCLNNNKHFLEQILVAALSLVKREDFSGLKTLLDKELRPLSRLLLLLGWTHCQSLESAKALLRILHENKELHFDSVLNEYANGLSAQIKILEWCWECNRNNISTKDLLRHLHSLDTHSALYVLHSLTNLPAQDEDTILAMLQAPALPGTSGSAELPETLRLVQCRNVALFQGFCAFKYALYALCVNAHKYSRCSECLDELLDETPGDQLATDGQFTEEGYQALFKTFISKCKQHLWNLPLTFRLELLENIYSLIFLSFDDFNSSRNDDIALEEDDEGEKDETEWCDETVGLDSTLEQTDFLESEDQTRTEYEETASRVSARSGNHRQADQKDNDPKTQTLSYLHIKHFINGVGGFLADKFAVEAFLKMLKEQLDMIDCKLQAVNVIPETDTEVDELLNSSITTELFNTRLQRLVKYISEAEWRFQVVTSNRLAEAQISTMRKLRPFGFRSSFKRRRRAGRNKADGALVLPVECVNGELSATASDGSAGTFSSHSDRDSKLPSVHKSLVIPMMLSTPESLLISSILRGNFSTAHQVGKMFSLEALPSFGELLFMELYQQVVKELEGVEDKIEKKTLDDSDKKTNSGRSTLKAIGSAAAAGMVFYSISDVADKLQSFPEKPVLALQDDFWDNCLHLESSGAHRDIVEDLSPAGMAAFDLACTQCRLFKTCKKLLEVAERRQHNTLDAKGKPPDFRVCHSDGIKGFPVFLEQLSKIMNHAPSSCDPTKSAEASEEKTTSPFSRSIRSILLTCYPTLTEDCIAAQLSISHKLKGILLKLKSAMHSADLKGGDLLSALVDQSKSRPHEPEDKSVRFLMKQLLKTVDLHIQMQAGRHLQVDYIRSFFDYVNTLAAVLVKSLNSETDHGLEVKLCNPLLVLHQTPSQLISQLLFEKQIPPDRISSLLLKEDMPLNVQQVIVNCCCETLPLWDMKKQRHNPSLLNAVSVFVHQYAKQHLPAMEEFFEVSDGSWSECITSTSPPLSPGEQTHFLLTPSALSLLKSHSSLLAAIACLTASKGIKMAKSGLSAWRDFRGRKEDSPDTEQLLKEFPILESFLQTMLEPLEESFEENGSLASALCGKPCVSLILSGLHCHAALRIAEDVFQEALANKDVLRALKVLELYGPECPALFKMKDILLSCAVVNEADGVQYLFLVKDADLRARLVLYCLERWHLDSAMEILQYCLSDCRTAEELKTSLLQKKNELQIYDKILNLKSTSSWADWRELKTESNSDPGMVMDIILLNKEFDLCRDWIQLYPVSKSLLSRFQREHLLHLLESGESEVAFQLLEGLSDPELCLFICEEALDQHPGLAACHFLTNYLTTHFHASVSAARRHEIQAIRIGSKLLLTLPETARQDYFHLSSSPLLMLEQLLMNMKVDWVAAAVKTLQQLLVGQEAGFTGEDIDDLLSRYAQKALDFPYAPRERSRSDSVISLQDLLNQTMGQDAVSPPSLTDPVPCSPAGSSPVHTPISAREKAHRKSKPTCEFTPPEKPPEKRHWVPDDQQLLCMVCKKERFTMFNRRHHCRRCGRLVCNSCSTKRMLVNGCREDAVRVCDQCYSFYHQDFYGNTSIHSGEGSPLQSTEEVEEPEVARSPDKAGLDFSSILQLPEAQERQWKLTLNESDIEIERSEFYYEQAPSASLCLAILNLNSNSIACGHQLIEQCRKLSLGLNNPEVDPRLITDIMKQLLVSAKLMFVKAGMSQDLALCDSYISKVDVLKILVTANYQYVPSLDQILQPAAVSRLRNQLLETEYYQLAVEVSTKSGLDPSGVWSAWGMVCLKAGSLSAAREKFSRCLKAPFDLNHLSFGSRLLQDIVQHLESTVKPSSGMADEGILASLKELEDALLETPASDKPEGKIQQNSNYQECLYYLHTYGTNLAIISFYMRHDCMKDALLHLLHKDCPDDVFLEGIFVASYESGKLHGLESLMESIDSSLESWSHYLIAACKHLQKRGFFNILYDLQQFMKDHVRAAMTCIRFFTYKAESYVDLGENQKWLVKAKDHLKTYLHECSSRGSARRKSSSSFRKKMSSTDVSRHVNTIELQIEVTKFLQRCESTGVSKGTGSTPANLFGNSHMKMEVACKVMLGGKNIEEGFGIAFRVIQDFQLDASMAYDKAGKRLVKQQQYKDIKQLLKCVSESGAATKNDCDNIILGCIEVADKGPAHAKELDSLILEMKCPGNKVKAYLLCRKLRPAYLTAVKMEQPQAGELVQEVLLAAETIEDVVMQDICRQWLSEHQVKAATRQMGHASHR